MLLEILAGSTTYLLLRRLCLSSWASAAAGVAFALNGTFAWLNNAPINPIAFLPVLLLGIEQAYSATTAGRRGGWWLIAVAGSLSLYAGFPEVAYIDGLLGLAWFVWRTACAGRGLSRRLASKCLVGVAVGTLLSAPQLIAAFDYLGNGELGPHGSDLFGKLHLSSETLPLLILPYLYGPIFAFGNVNVLIRIWGPIGGYMSVLAIPFALIGLASRGRRGLRITLAIWLAIAMARIYGAPPGAVFSLLPGMGRVAFFRYAFPSVELALAILIGLGLDELGVRGRSQYRIWGASLVALGLVAGAAAEGREVYHELGAGTSRHPYFYGSIAWGGGLVITGGIIAVVSKGRMRVRLAAVLVALEAIILFLVPAASAPRRVEIDTAPVAFLQQNLGRQRFFTLGPLQPNYGSYFGVGELNVDDIPIPSYFAQFIHTRLDQAVEPVMFVGNSASRDPTAPTTEEELLRNLDAYKEAGVSYVLAPPGVSLPSGGTGLKLVLRSRTTWIYRLAGAAPYFTATDRACALMPHGRSSVTVRCSAPATLVRRETALPGWSAQVDGSRTRVTRVDGLFQAVDVGAGTHLVTFGYSPPYMTWGFVAFAAGVVWLLLGARRSPAVQPSPRHTEPC
jgi:hypothetical protein